MGAGKCVTSFDLAVFADQAAEAVPAHNAHTGQLRRRTRTPSRLSVSITVVTADLRFPAGLVAVIRTRRQERVSLMTRTPTAG